VQEWAVAEMRARNFNVARDMFVRALALNPRHVPALAACAQCEGLVGHLNAARNLYARALQVCGWASPHTSTEASHMIL